MGWAVRLQQERIACALAMLILLLLVAPPLLAVVAAAIDASGDVWRTVFRSRQIELFGNSVTIALATTALSTAVGVPLGALLGRTQLRFAGAALFLHAIPLALPPFVNALTAFHLFGREGWLGCGATWLFGVQGCILVLTVSFAPVVTVLTWLGVRGTDPVADEAARISAGAWSTLWRIVLPQAVPSIALGAIVVFSLTLIEVAVPMFLRVHVYSSAIFARLGGFAFAPGEAAALTLPLIILSAMLWIAGRVGPVKRSLVLPSVRTRTVPLLEAMHAKTITTVVALLAAVIGAAPILVMGIVAVRGDGFSLLSIYAGNAVSNSILYAASVSTLVVVLAVIVISAVRTYPRLVGAMDAMSWLGFLLPPALFAIGAITFWNRPATQWVYGSAGVVILALATRYAVLAIRMALAGHQQLSPSLDEAARTCGATFMQRMLRIQVPALRRFTAGAWLLVFVFCLRDIETTATLYPPDGDPLTVRLFTLEANGPPAVTAALAVVLALLTLIPLAIASLGLRNPR
jgi:iron(III) transport system permease protein